MKRPTWFVLALWFALFPDSGRSPARDPIPTGVSWLSSSEQARRSRTSDRARQLDQVERLLNDVRTSEVAGLVDGTLLEAYHGAIVRGEQVALELRAAYEKADPERHARLLGRLSDLLSRLGARRVEVERAHAGLFASRTLVGDPRALSRPDFVIVLGCQNRRELGARIEKTRELLVSASSRSQPTVIVSGGSKLDGRCESEVMKTSLIRAMSGRLAAGSVLCEVDSLDTVGNAVFCGLLMRRLRLTSERGGEEKRLLVVTSDFHAARSHEIFSRVFPRSFAIAVAGVKRPDRSTESVARWAGNELRSQHRSAREILSLTDLLTGQPESIEPGALDDLLVQMYLKHDLYHGRTDLLRRYLVSGPGLPRR
ncbi:MAG: YdcF family protein [Candidatus Riflebacteria bacterium]|nr:YdcF family protein [Candidatus Riflebacteria bacterium]